MTDQKPDAGDPTESTDTASASPEPDGPAVEQTADALGAAAPDAGSIAGAADEVAPGETLAAETRAAEGAGGEPPPADGDPAEGDTGAEGADEGLADSAASTAGAAWTTTPVAPDPEATEAALAALAAKPEVTLEPPETPPPPPPPAGLGGEPPDEGTPVLLVGGILVGAFVVALAIVLILFRPFESSTDVEPTLSPSPVVTEAPSASPTAIPIVDTPNFQGRSLDEAELLAEDYGLVVRANPFETDEFDEGTVLNQEPAPGEAVEPGTTIELAVAVPVPMQPVPDVVGLTTDDAIDAIEDAGFVVGDIFDQSSDTYASGLVIRTIPAVASELSPGSSIDLVVSLGPLRVAVPDITDLPEPEALTALEAAGLLPGSRGEANDEVIVAGNVISSDPLAADEVAPGSEVSYIVSLGPLRVAVPDITDLPEPEALTALEAAGLLPGSRGEANDEVIVAGNVISSDPLAADEVAPGSEVSYIVSLGPLRVAVPDITDLPEPEALTALEAAGLLPGSRGEANDEVIVAGNVISSDPLAADEVAPGSEVSYIVSLGPLRVAVPDITDLPEPEALTALEAAGLLPGSRGEANDEVIVAGNVISSDPLAADEVAPGSEVSYIVSLGPLRVAVPDITDLPEPEALTALEAAGLLPGSRGEANDEVIVAGNVISSDPLAADEVAPGSEVSYIVSLGPLRVAVPDITDLPEPEALTALEAAGLLPGSRGEANDEVIVAGNVISSDPLAADEVAPGSEVSYIVSLGPLRVAVPDITDLPEPEALTALEAAGLLPGSRGEANDEVIVAGNVISSDPLAADEVAPGSEVSYIVSLGPLRVAVPDITDLPEPEALTALEAAGLLPGSRGEANDEVIVAGNVISSDPLAADEVAPGSEVSYIVSLGPLRVAVPDITDLPEPEALTALEAAGLLPGSRGEANDEVIVAGNVISSDPLAADEVAPGSEVSYIVSLGPLRVAVPDITDLPEPEALTALEAAGLLPGSRGEANDEVIVAGNVISSDPLAADEVAPGSEVSYIVSLGPLRVAVPDITDLPEPEALTALEAAGLLPGSRGEANDEVIVAGNVISSDPLAADEVAPGSEVSYIVSLGPLRVAVPDITDLPEPEALTALEAAGLLPGSRGEANDEVIVAGNVISSDPLAADEVAPGSEVSYIVSLGPLRVAVPDITDLPEPEALTALEAAGLLPGSRGEANDEVIVAGNVISSDPLAADEVAPGSEVSYIVSLGPLRVAVPDITDLPEPEALTALEAAGLLPGSRGEANDEVIVAGNVISSDPLAADEVAPGSEVSYIVSLGPLRVAVPDITDLPEPEALTALEAAGLLPGSRGEANDEVIVAGNVISSDPLAADEVAPGSEVSYIVSLGPLRVAVPDITDLPEPEALTALEAAGLLPGSRGEANDEVIVAGNVISSDPLAADEVAPGSEVSYIVSLGPLRVAVPDITDLPEPEALTALEAAGLLPGSRGEANDEVIVAGNVISSDPLAADEVAPGSEVSYIVSLGPLRVAVPDITDLPEPEALTALEAAGLLPGSRGEANDEVIVAGNVISSDPLAADEVAPGSEVSYIVSLGPLRVAVPDITDLPEPEALTALEAAGLLPGSRGEANDEVIVAGNVISSDPLAADEVAPGSEVSYIVSLGPLRVAVPDITDLPEPEALTALEAAGLLPGSRGEANDEVIVAGNVISSDPLAADEVAPGSEVSYIVSLGPLRVAVPDITDLPEPEALTALEAAGLLPGSRGEANDEVIVAGNVISSDPLAADEVAPGSEVSYIVSLGPLRVAVPDITDLPEPEALTALEAAGLLPGSRGEANDEVIAAGNVISSDPLAADEVAPGSEVSYVVSLGPLRVAVPDITDLPEPEALTALEAAGLLPGSRGEANDEVIAAGNVISSDPLAADEVAPGSEVSYVVSLGPLRVAVPDITDLPEPEALTALEAAGLLPGSRGEANDEVIAAGNVISSDPLAADEVAPGSEVSYVVSLGPLRVAVPDITDLPEPEALTALEAAGLLPGSRGEANDEVIAAGNVISSDPLAADEVAPGSEVSYVVSLGPLRVAVPDITDLPEPEALTALEAAGLLPGSRGEANDEVIAAGNVISSDPLAADEVAPGSEVSYVVSLGPLRVAVPDITDLPEPEALTALEAAGLLPGSRGEANDEVIAAGNVISSDPLAADEVAPGSEVSYVVSLGPLRVAVPDITDLPEPEALTALEAAGLLPGSRGEANDEVIAAGNVISSDPLAADEVAPGSEVSYVVSLGPLRVAVPDITDLPEPEALTALEAAGLLPGSRGEANDEVIAAGNVISSDPLAADEVAPGSEVSYVVSLGPLRVAVPDITDLPEPEALTALEAAGLLPGSRGEANDEVIAAGNVISSDPLAADEVAPGSEVSYVVSLGPLRVAVPDITDLPEPEALTALEAAGLLPGSRGEANDEVIAAGNVISSDPLAADEVAPGSEVSYVVSLGPLRVAVPDITDLPEPEALTALEAAGLLPGSRGEANDEVIAAGNVISSDPLAADEVAPGSEVSYVVSLGPLRVAVPDITDLPEPEALTALEAAGLLPGSRGEANDEVIAAGNVISSDPLAADEVAPGSEVSYVVSLGPLRVAVPDITDLPEPEALTALEAAGLLPGSRGEANDEVIAAGNVISSDPLAADEVAPGSEVSYVVSLGPLRVAVPDITDLPEPEALTALEAAGLLPGSRGEANDEVIAAGNVISSDPLAADEVAPGSEVSYVVSLGPLRVAVPDITDLPEPEALTALEAAGLLPGSRGEANDEVIAAGNVISSDPLAADEVAPGSEVSYVVSLGPLRVAVPDITDLPEPEALTALEAAGLLPGSRGEANDEVIAAGNVISSDPLAADEVAPGSEVSYVVSLGPLRVAVPDITDLPEPEALTALEAAGLLPGSRGEANDEVIAAGNVISSDPLAADEVAPGSEVSYVVSLGPLRVAVPDITDLPEPEALTALEAAGLLPGSRGEANDEVIAAGNVISSDPLAADEVAPGSEVSYVVSLGPLRVAVPDITDLPEPEALTALEAAGLLPGSRGEANDEVIAAGNVISSDPLAADEVAPGSEVSYVVSLGIEQVEVPEVKDLPAADAITMVEAAGLFVGQTEERTNATVPAGSAVRTDPAAGTSVDKGSSLVLVISKGPKQVDVPDVVGLPEADAVAALQSADLTTGDRSGDFSDTIPVGSLISSDPAAGVTVDAKSPVSYVISLGIEQVEVPDLGGAAADAEDTLAAAGLGGSSSEAFSDTIAAGDVISQDPTPGTSVDIGSEVSYVVSLGIEQVEVPEVKDLPAADAITMVEAAGLFVGQTEERTNATVPAGSAVRTDPAAGTSVDKGSSLVLVISKGPKQVDVPDVVGLPEADAVAALQSADLTTGDRSGDFSDTIPVGSLISSDPAAGVTVDAKSPVSYVISLGIEQVEVPDLGGAAADAEDTLAAAGLGGSSSEAFSDTIAAGDVISQDPTPGTSVDIGSEVSYVVSLGITPAVMVPEVRNLPEADAIAAIEAANLLVGQTIEQFHEKVAAGDAIKTDPATGAEILFGSQVTLFVSTGSSTRTIPEVRGQPAAEAQAALEAEGLVVATQEKTNAQVAAGAAVKTAPAAGEQVAPGTEVLLTISKGPKPVVVPDITGSLQKDARAAITAAGLTVGESSTVQDDAPRNTVLSQDPVAAAEVPQGTAVDYTVSSGPTLVTIPEVRGQPAAEAQAALEAEGLVVATQEKTNAQVAAGAAVKTAPAAGEQVAPGTEVLLTISRGPKPVVVPDITGSLQKDARAAITAAGLTVGESSTVQDDAPRNTVLSQDPVAAAEVPQGTAVDYTVSSGPTLVTIPEVRGQPAAEAQAALEAEGLVVATQEKTNAQVAAGAAVKTAPAAGEQVAPGTEVLLTISRGPKPVVVPDITGSLQKDARAAITAAGLTVGESSTVQDDAPRNTVLSQDPVAAAEVPQGTAVDYTVSSGPTLVTIPEVRGQPAAEAQAALEAEGLVVATQEKTNAQVAAGAAVKTAPAAGEQVAPGTEVLLTISRGPKPVVVPDITGLPEAEALAALEEANLDPGVRTEAIDETIPRGSVIDENPDDGSVVERGTDIDYVVSLGSPIPSRGAGGSLDNQTVITQLDAVAATIPEIRELELGSTPYDGASGAEQASVLAERANILREPSTIAHEESALKRMGLLGESDDLASLLDQLYGQDLPIGYLEQRGRQSVLSSIDKFNVPDRAEAAREFGRAAVLQDFGATAARVADSSEGDEARAALALELGDGTATMLDWATQNVNSGNQSKVDGVIVPGDDGVYASMPPLLQREYSFPYLEGRLFVDRLREAGGWGTVDSAWSALPESTEQIMHPKLYRSDRPTTIDMSSIASRLGGGFKERWQQTMGELRIGVWLADGQPGTQQGPKAPVKLPKANAAAGWGGDRLVSLDGPDGTWAIVWQTKWDKPGDIGQFTKAASAAIADLEGVHAVLEADVSSGVSNPALVLLASDADTLASVADALGVAVEGPAS